MTNLTKLSRITLLLALFPLIACSSAADELRVVDVDGDSVKDGEEQEREETLPDRSELAAKQTPKCFAYDKENVYWMNEDGIVAGAPKTGGGGAVATSRHAIPGQVVEHCGLALDPDGSALYATLFSAARIVKLSLERSTDVNGKPRVTIGTTATQFGDVITPSSIAIDATSVYVTESSTGALKKLAKPNGIVKENGAPTTSLLALGGAGAREVITDTDFVYWLDDQGLRKVGRMGGPMTTLAQDYLDDEALEFDDGAHGLALANGFLVWHHSQQLWSISIHGSGSGARQIATPDPDRPSGSKRASSVEERNDGIVEMKSGKRASSGDDDSFALEPDMLRLEALATFDGAMFLASKKNIYRTDKATGLTTKLFAYRTPDEAGATQLVFDGVTFFWESEGTIWSRPLALPPSPATPVK